MHKKLFIPGPTEVLEEIRKEMSRPMIGHRSKEFSELYSAVVPKVQELLYTQNKIFLSTSSALGLMEAAIRNCVKKKSLHLVCGAFSNSWEKIAKGCGRETDRYEIDFGKGFSADMVRERLENNSYDAVCLTHNETSTGVMHDIEAISKVMKDYPDTMFLVDAVSSMSGVKLEVDKLGIDVCLASVQKCFALPPGFSLCSISEKAFEKSKEIEGRGYYFDYQTMLKYDGKQQTISTPSIPHIYALKRQLERIFEEGAENRFARHEKMAGIVRKWVSENFSMFAQEGFWSNTLTVADNREKQIDVAGLNTKLAEKNKMIANGYGPIKEKTFRIAHMGDLQEQDLKELLDDLDGIIKN